MTLEQMKTIKKNLGISVREISENTGIPFGTVQKIFGGETVNPRFGTIVKLDDYFVARALKYLNDTYTEPLYVRDPHRYIPTDSSAEELDYFELTLGKRQGEFTVADRDSLPDEIRTELIDGYIYYLAAPNRRHQTIAGLLYTELINHALNSERACLPHIAPVDVNLDNDDKTMLQPDVLVLCHEDRDPRYVHGAPEFVVEIMSKPSWKRDAVLKLNKYLNAGVKEYWLVDPDQYTVTVYDFAGGTQPAQYSFDETVPVGISEGECSIDFRRIRDTLIRYFDR